ncbi:MAG: outer membrane beta-barrel protein [Bacteroidota bacterium]
MKTNKAFIFFFLFASNLLLTSVSAQQQKSPNLLNLDRAKYHFGFLLGFNQMNFAIKPYSNLAEFDSLLSVESKSQLGFDIGIVSNLKLATYWDLRFIPTLSFGERDVAYSIRNSNSNFVGTITKKVESIFIDFPFHVKLKSARIGDNTRAYVIAGGKISIDMASQSKQKEDNPEDIKVKLYRDDYLLEAGVGFDFYMEYFKLATEIKMSYGFKDQLVHENNLFASSIERLNSKIFQFSLTFEGGKY